MLEAIVEQVQLRSELLFRKNAGGVAVFADDDRDFQAPRQKQWLIAEIARGAGGIDQGHASGLAPVAAGEDIEFDASFFQQLAQKQHKRRFARSADGQVSHAHHRAARASGRERCRGHRARFAREPRVRRVS